MDKLPPIEQGELPPVATPPSGSSMDNVSQVAGTCFVELGPVQLPPSPDVIVRAAFQGDLGELKRANDLGCDLNQPDSRGECPIHAAIRGRQVRVLDFLIDVRCDPWVRNSADELPGEADPSILIKTALEHYRRIWGDPDTRGLKRRKVEAPL